MFSAIAEGENPINAFLKSVGQSLTQLITKLLAAAAAAAILSAILPGGFQGAKGFSAIFGKIFGFAHGGIVTQPTLAMVGEGGESEAIIPLSKLPGLINTAGGGYNERLVANISGNDLQLILARTGRKQSRNG